MTTVLSRSTSLRPVDDKTSASLSSDQKAAGPLRLESHLGRNPSDFSRILASAFDSRDSLYPRKNETRSEEHTSELQSLMRTSYAVFCLKKKTTNNKNTT